MSTGSLGLPPAAASGTSDSHSTPHASPLTPGFPTVRMRRLRGSATMRRMVRETRLSADDLILPLFVDANISEAAPISSMPGVNRLTVELAVDEAVSARKLGIPAMILFGLPEAKDALGSEAYAPNGIVQRATRAIKAACPEMVIIGDVCLCEYTTHGHCGVIRDGEIDNDRTLELLAAVALSQAEAGVDVVAPSDMMDGRVGAIRQALDAAGFHDRLILAYSAKFASGFYGPFREAAGSAPQFGDRRTYQMDPPNGRETMREIELDVREGADMIMIKPALAYLDLIVGAREAFDLPLVAYNVSGEFAMIKAAAANGWIGEQRIVYEVLIGIRRAGADLIITYHAKDAARWLREGSF